MIPSVTPGHIWSHLVTTGHTWSHLFTHVTSGHTWSHQLSSKSLSTLNQRDRRTTQDHCTKKSSPPFHGISLFTILKHKFFTFTDLPACRNHAYVLLVLMDVSFQLFRGNIQEVRSIGDNDDLRSNHPLNSCRKFNYVKIIVISFRLVLPPWLSGRTNIPHHLSVFSTNNCRLVKYVPGSMANGCALSPLSAGSNDYLYDMAVGGWVVGGWLRFKCAGDKLQ